MPLTIRGMAIASTESAADSSATAPPAGLLRRQRGLPLPRAGVRGAAVRPRGRPRGGLAADRIGRRDLRAVAATVAACGLGADGRTLLAWGTVLAAMNCSSTWRSTACRWHRRGHRVPPGRRLAVLGARTRRNLAALALAVAGVYLLTDVALDGDPLGVAFAFVNAALFAGYIIVSHRAAQNGSVPGIDLLGMAMLIAAVVATPIGAWAAVPAFGDPVAIAAGIGVGVSSSVIPYVTDQLAMARMPRSTYALDGRAPAGDGDGHRHRRPRPAPQRGRGPRRRARHRRRRRASRRRRRLGLRDHEHDGHEGEGDAADREDAHGAERQGPALAAAQRPLEVALALRAGEEAVRRPARRSRSQGARTARRRRRAPRAPGGRPRAPRRWPPAPIATRPARSAPRPSRCGGPDRALRAGAAPRGTAPRGPAALRQAAASSSRHHPPGQSAASMA